MSECCGKFLRVQRGKVAVTHRETLIKKVDWCSFAEGYIKQSYISASLHGFLLWQRLRDLKETGDVGWCWNDGSGNVVASGVGLACCSPGDWTGIT